MQIETVNKECCIKIKETKHKESSSAMNKKLFIYRESALPFRYDPSETSFNSFFRSIN